MGELGSSSVEACLLFCDLVPPERQAECGGAIRQDVTGGTISFRCPQVVLREVIKAPEAGDE